MIETIVGGRMLDGKWYFARANFSRVFMKDKRLIILDALI